MAAGLITMHEDGLNAVSGIVGVAVPSNEHCETMRRSEITVVTRGPFRWVVGERSRARPPHSILRVACMAAGLISMNKDGLDAASGIVGVAVPSDEHCETMRRSEITVVTRGPFRSGCTLGHPKSV